MRISPELRVFSGSLSYIFNEFSGKIKVSLRVTEAMNGKYTEPDPREDLSGNDVGRNCLFLLESSICRMSFLRYHRKSYRGIIKVSKNLYRIEELDQKFINIKRTEAKSCVALCRCLWRLQQDKGILEVN